ncbi:protein kinase [Sorangium cellulosum]|uniref:Protein kinase n=1 Tax=Sorangium cellulosum TaxID=56 RepID=A0A2L0F259_SORCE|nr:serine/threonine-protein kinase [Sorangium cellulosum]AUX45623.1 protein kinase [Sorangium cellulosum]
MPDGRQREVTGGSSPSRSAAPDPLLGRVINGRFKVVSVIARGGMGKVYRAEQAPLGRICALKVLSPKYDGDHDPEFHRRFFLEASTAAKLSHPNTVTVFDYGHTDDDIYYIAMEYIEGKTLHRVLREEGPFSEARTAHIARQIGRSLREAHGLGVVHRDLKPGNVLLVDHEDEHDHVKVLDFGLVKDTESGEDLTQQGLFMGSPKYMAPEQITNGGVSARTDIYALGVMMYEMLSGHVPFDKGASVGTLMSHVNDQVPPMQTYNLGLAVSPAMAAIVYRCLEKDPALRFSSMNELVAALKLTEGGVVTREAGDSLPVLAGPGAAGHRSSMPSLSTTGDIPGISSPSSLPPASTAVTYTGPLSTETTLQQPSPPVFVTPSITDSMGPRPAPSPEELAPLAAAASPGRRLTPWAIAAVLAAGVGVAAVVASRPQPEQPASAARGEPGAAGTPPAETTAPAPIAAAAAPRTLRVESAPPGAAVREGNKELCAETPCEITWRGAAAEPASEHELVFEKKGFKAATVRVSGAEEKVRAKLDPAAIAPAATPFRPRSSAYKPDPYKSNPY